MVPQGRNRTTDTAIFSPWRGLTNHFLEVLKSKRFYKVEAISGARNLPFYSKTFRELSGTITREMQLGPRASDQSNPVNFNFEAVAFSYSAAR